MHFRNEIKQNYIKQHKTLGAKWRETPENCRLSAQGKVGVTLVTAKLYQGETRPQNSFKYRKWDLSLLKSPVSTYRTTTQFIMYNFRSERAYLYTRLLPRFIGCNCSQVYFLKLSKRTKVFS